MQGREKELKLLKEFQVYDEFPEEKVEDKEILPCTWVLTEKDADSGKVTKARLRVCPTRIMRSTEETIPQSASGA